MPSAATRFAVIAYPAARGSRLGAGTTAPVTRTCTPICSGVGVRDVRKMLTGLRPGARQALQELSNTRVTKVTDLAR